MSSGTTGSFFEILVYGGAIGALAIGSLAACIYVSRKIKRDLAEDSVQTPFALSDLRDMRDSGAISEREFETMRAAVIEALSGKAPTENAGIAASGLPTPPDSTDERDDSGEYDDELDT